MGGNVMKTRAEIFASASVVGGKEFDGPLGKLFDFCDPCDRFGMKTWEKSESEMLSGFFVEVYSVYHQMM